jgi:NADH dehydrogenase
MRPSVIFGAGDSLNTFNCSRFPVIGRQRSPAVVGDVASAVVQCLQDTDTIGQVYEARNSM